MRFHLRRRLTPAVLPPVPVPPAPAAPCSTTYTVTYHRVGEWGRDGKPAPAPLTVAAITRDEIAAAISRDVRSYLPAGSTVTVVVDLAVMAGQIRVGSLPVGTFALRLRAGGAR